MQNLPHSPPLRRDATKTASYAVMMTALCEKSEKVSLIVFGFVRNKEKIALAQCELENEFSQVVVGFIYEPKQL